VNYGDGSGTSAVSVGVDGSLSLSHAYANTGSYQISVVASDGFGGTGTRTIEVNVIATPTPTPAPTSTLTPALPVSGLGAGRDAFVITLYRELLGEIPTIAELIAEARKLKNNAAYSKVGQSIHNSKPYKLLQRQHKGTNIPYPKAYHDAIAARNLAMPPVVTKKK
jgi:hypothetical protein